MVLRELPSKPTLRPSLKDLKDALNGIDDDFLAESYIAFDAMLDTPQELFAYVVDGDNLEDVRFAEPEVVNVFIDFLNKDLRQARIRQGEQGYDEEYNITGDW